MRERHQVPAGVRDGGERRCRAADVDGEHGPVSPGGGGLDACVSEAPVAGDEDDQPLAAVKIHCSGSGVQESCSRDEKRN